MQSNSTCDNTIIRVTFLGMANPKPSTFVGNIQQKIFKQMENSAFHSIFHDTTVTANLFEILEMLPGIHLEHEMK